MLFASRPDEEEKRASPRKNDKRTSSNENSKTNTQARPKSAAGATSARHALPSGEGAYLDEKPVEGGGKTFEQLLAENLGGEAIGGAGGASPRKPVKR